MSRRTVVAAALAGVVIGAAGGADVGVAAGNDDRALAHARSQTRAALDLAAATQAQLDAAQQPAPTTAPASPAPGAQQQDKQWSLITYRAADRGSITARIRNDHDVAESAFFSLTLLNGTDPVAHYVGVANSVGPGQTVTVAFSTTTPPSAGVHATAMEFQVDTSTDS